MLISKKDTSLNYCYRIQNHSATKFCTPDATWFVHPHTNATWTNYTQCTNQGKSIVPDQLIANIVKYLIKEAVYSGFMLQYAHKRMSIRV
ncbi:Calcitonin-like peptide type 1 receptor [Orchesella cincta]|uniref:Calcitonin-like peptide type 1 receptor n=1 Tax=Orchesella cincta TaxID=48709 RepID=A0A1D2NBQ0_ORCCI|nr:Calcitonin-like peptide type 1 receptor [Orchesella cincta]